MQRFGWMGQLKSDMVEKYVELHAQVWPQVLRSIETCNLQNYSIFHRAMASGEHLLFSYVEYTGTDFEADMRHMAADPDVQRWWAECKPCFEHIENLPPDEVWVSMDSIFYHA